MVNDWIALLADDERKRDEVRSRESAAAERRATVARVHGRRLVDALRAVVTRDVELFRREFPDDQARAIVIEDGRPEGGFAVGKAIHPAVSLDIMPHLGTAGVSCRYRFTPNNGLPPREDRVELVFSGDGEESFQIKHQGTGQTFVSADALSEYLLTPVFTGRAR
jgi:hypothetical protein